jgi:hypothetical protein
MTKSTLNNLWLAAGGLLATWLAVFPNTATPIASNHGGASPAAAVHTTRVDDMSVPDTKVRSRAGNVPFRPSTRNPFRFGKVVVSGRPHSSAVAPGVAAPETLAPPPPSFALAGIATEGPTRTAIISGGGQLYLVKEGETVAERYRVVKIESDAATLRDEAGTETRLVFH